MRPSVGLNPKMPQNDAGRITEPAVWVPSASGIMPDATPAAEPDDEPPGVCAVLRGFRVAPGVELASSVVTVLPMMMAPAERSAATQCASSRGRYPSNMVEPYWVGMSAVSMMSLMPTGTPCSGPVPLPSRRSSSARRAWSSAWPGSRNAQAWISGSSAAMRARQASTSSTLVRWPSRMAAAAAVAVRSAGVCGAALDFAFLAIGSS